jgi:hypothetical protein
MRLADIHEALSARHLGGALWGLERLILELSQEEAMSVRQAGLDNGVAPHLFNH